MLPMERWRDGFDERYPIYQQIISRFTSAIVRKELKPGERVLSIRDMALVLRVNTNTVARAYQEMERLQLIFSQRGTGYFVSQEDGLTERIETQVIQEIVARFLKEMRELGLGDSRIIEELKLVMEGGAVDAIIDGNGR